MRRGPASCCSGQPVGGTAYVRRVLGVAAQRWTRPYNHIPATRVGVPLQRGTRLQMVWKWTRRSVVQQCESVSRIRVSLL
jgi:hypothetical protein